jgi:hypothetical protein
MRWLCSSGEYRFSSSFGRSSDLVIDLTWFRWEIGVPMYFPTKRLYTELIKSGKIMLGHFWKVSCAAGVCVPACVWERSKY